MLSEWYINKAIWFRNIYYHDKQNIYCGSCSNKHFIGNGGCPINLTQKQPSDINNCEQVIFRII